MESGENSIGLQLDAHILTLPGNLTTAFLKSHGCKLSTLWRSSVDGGLVHGPATDASWLSSPRFSRVYLHVRVPSPQLSTTGG